MLRFSIRLSVVAVLISVSSVVLFPQATFAAELKAGAAVVDVTPAKFPVLVNGGMTTRSAAEVTTPINARAIVVDGGGQRVGIVVVDSCMMPRPLLDEAKALAAMQTKIAADHILISATHTHTAPSSMGALGTDADADYLPVLRAGIVDALVKAESHLEPAQVGWAVQNAADYTALRRWIRRPDRIAEDPFGNLTVRANMHAGRNWDDVTGESGPEDPDLSLISFQAISGRPIAVLANFSMHYFSGQKPLAADYFGLFCDGMQQKLNESTDDHPPFVGIMSHGCSGDIWRRDYKLPTEQQEPQKSIEEFADGLLEIAMKGYQSVEYQTDADVVMAEVRPVLKYRVPDLQRLQWAQKIVQEMGDRPPRTTQEVYAREALLLHELQSTEIVVQALRIGEIGIATTPNETYALTGLKVKLQSPLPKTMVIELANGGDGYIPPPEQHLLGGYNTWAARSAGLEVTAEPKIAEHALQLLEDVSGKSRRTFVQSRGTAAEAIAAEKPLAWWRLDEMSGPWAQDSSEHQRPAFYEPAVAYFLDGPASDRLCRDGETNRCAHFAGDRLNAQLPLTGDDSTLSLWFWNGMPADARAVTGWMYSRGPRDGLAVSSEHLGLSGTDQEPGRLLFQSGRGDAVIGKTVIERWSWNHVAIVRTGQRVQVFLNGANSPEIDTTAPACLSANVFFGGRTDGTSSWEGRLDEIAVFDKALSGPVISKLAATESRENALTRVDSEQ
ncbi:MAG: LamG-like jellyroll fold domain-containing protein [Planctomycetaceae bacterium]